MKIQIINGVYGHVENGIPTPKTKDSEPFEVSDKKAQELIAAGVAKKASGLKSEADKPIRYRESLAPKNNEVKATKTEENQPPAPVNEEGTEGDTDETENATQYSMNNSKPELLKFAEDLGVEISDPENTTKKQIIELLDAATAGDAPQFGNDDGIVN